MKNPNKSFILISNVQRSRKLKRILGKPMTKKACMFYCNNNKNCSEAEKILRDSGIPFHKIQSSSKEVPILVSVHQTSKGLENIRRFADGASALKKAYSIDWF